MILPFAGALRGMTGRVSGIYGIANTVTWKIYIGSAVDVYGRWRGHRSKLRRGKHSNSYLQRSFAKHGENSFAFWLLEEVPAEKDLLVAAEQRWLDETRCYEKDRGYNMNSLANSTLGLKYSEEAKARISAARKGKKLSEETKARISAAHKKLARASGYTNPMLGKKPSEETKTRMSAALKGKKRSEETKARMSAARKKQVCTDGYTPPMLGRKHTEEAKALMSTTHKEKKLSKEAKARMSAASVRDYLVQYLDEGSFQIRNLKEFCRRNGLYYNGMHRVASGRFKQYRGWKCAKLYGAQ